MTDINDILKIRTNNLKPTKGKILISEPFLADPNFARTVILLCEHNDEGSFGFVLNKLAQVKFSLAMSYPNTEP